MSASAHPGGTPLSVDSAPAECFLTRERRFLGQLSDSGTRVHCALSHASGRTDGYPVASARAHGFLPVDGSEVEGVLERFEGRVEVVEQRLELRQAATA